MTSQPDVPVSRAYTELLRRAVDWVWQTDVDLTLTYLSPGLRSGIGRSLPGLAATQGEAPSPLLTALGERRPFRDCPLDLIDDEGRPTPCRLTGMPFQDESSGGFAGYRGTARRAGEDAETGGGDETAQRLLDLLRAALGEKDRLERRVSQLETRDLETETLETQVTALAPELRSRLTAILAFSETIRDQLFGDDPGRYVDHAGAIHRDARKLAGLIDRIPGQAEQEAEQERDPREFELRPLDIAGTLYGVAGNLSDKAAAAEVRLSTFMARDLPEALGDRRIFHRILFQLLSRFIDLAAPGATLLVQVELESGPGDGAVVAVSLVDSTMAQGSKSGTAPAEDAEAPDDANGKTLRRLAESMGASLVLTGRPGQAGRATLRLVAQA